MDKETGEIYENISFLAEGTLVNGNIETKEDFVLEGHVIGDIYCKSCLEIKGNGVVEGGVVCQKLELEGTINGDVKVSGIAILKEKSIIRGTLQVVQLIIDPAASIEKGLNITEII